MTQGEDSHPQAKERGVWTAPSCSPSEGTSHSFVSDPCPAPDITGRMFHFTCPTALEALLPLFFQMRLKEAESGTQGRDVDKGP